MNVCRLLLALFLLASSVNVNALGLFWQPQERDLAIDDQKWTILMQEIRHQGFSRLILQWTRYGDSFTESEQLDALYKKALIANESGLELVIGLYLDPEFYSLQKQPINALQNYLRKQRSLDVGQAKVWRERLSAHISGWYISAEIDDENWRDTAKKNLLLQWLTETGEELNKIDKIPIYISSFFTGKMSPSAYVELLASIEKIGYGLWIQDGGGVGVLSEQNRELYLDKAVKCTNDSHKPVIGVVFELFDVESDAPFSAIPKATETIERLITQKNNCSAQRLFFSLRYLPASKIAFSFEQDVDRSD